MSTSTLAPAGRPAGDGLSDLEDEILLSLYQHRLLSVEQIHDLHTPHSSMRWTRRVIKGLGDLGYADRVLGHSRHSQARPGLWFLSPLGYDIVAPNGHTGGGPQRRDYRMNHDRAAGPLQSHLTAVNAVGTAFVTWSRRLGHDCSSADWDNEAAFRIADKAVDGPYSDLLTADAVLRMTLNDPEAGTAGITRFIELDRGTKNVSRVHEQLRRYAQLCAYVPSGDRAGPRYTVAGAAREPGWKRQFPQRFPQVLCVFTGKPERLLALRIEALTDLCASDPFLSRFADPLGLAFTTLEQLTARGPFAAVWQRPFSDSDGPVDLLGRPAGDALQVGR